MKTYMKLLKLGAFTINDLDEIYGNRNSAASAVRSLVKNGLVKRIRKNLYVCNDVENRLPVADKYKIGSSITKDAYISHYSALEFHGFVGQDESFDYDLNQSNYKTLKKKIDFDLNGNLRNHDKIQYIFVTSPSIFKPFTFDGITYNHVAFKFGEGVLAYDTKGVVHYNTKGVVINDKRGLMRYDTKGAVTCNSNREIRVTNIERTVIDCIKDIDRAGGIEEFLQALKRVSSLDSGKLIQYLKMYDIQYLYQKAGYILELFNNQFKLPRKFFDLCQSEVKSTRYLTNMHEDDLHYIAKWHLIVSSELSFLINWL